MSFKEVQKGTKPKLRIIHSERSDERKDDGPVSDQKSSDLMRIDLGNSGLDEKTCKALRYVPLTPEQCKELTGRNVPAFKIPYFDISGNVSKKFFRVKFMAPVKEGFASKKNIKYWQPPETLPEFYLPRTIDWKTVSQNAGLEIIFTEGEKKAARACAAGYNCISIGGVWAWRSKKKGLPTIPDFEQFQWANRTVYLCFDSDMYNNPLVVQALHALSMELLHMGAHVFTISLQPHKDFPNEKVGLDDFIVQNGEAAFRRLVEEKSGEFKPSSALWELNEKLCYVRDKAAILEIDAGVFHRTSQSLTNVAFANHKFSVADGTKILAKNAAKEWLRWSRRREHTSISYEPGLAAVLDGNVLNTWRGWGVEPKKGDIAPFYELVDFIFKDAPGETKTWFLQWLAYPLQNPGEKLMQAVVIWSRYQGMGKSFVGYIMADIYGKNFQKITQRDLGARFNGWLAHKQFILGEEIVGMDNRQDADFIKELITQEQIYVNQKFQPEYTIPDKANFYFTSNHPDAIFLERTDRRFFVQEVTGIPLKPSKYKAIDKWRKHGGAAHVFYHLLEDIDCSEFNPKGHAPSTKAKEEMISHSLSDLDVFAERLKDDPEHVLMVDSVKADRDLFSLNEIRLFLPDHLASKNPTNTALGKSLRRAGLTYYTTRTLYGVKYLWALKNAKKWESAEHSERAAHYEGSKKFIEKAGSEKFKKGE